MTDLATAPRTMPNDILREEYNKSPYQSFPFFQTHPNHLFTLATLFGLSPTPLENARVLELGCASGGNLIPMAYLNPKAEFLGIELAEKQVEDGLRQIKELKLKNLTLRHQSITEFEPVEGKFDYIICHGVYSWVDIPVREKILDICHHNLNKDGIAYVSYNTFPGWNMVNSVKDLMQWHTKAITDPAVKAQQARIVLKFITDGLSEDKSPYAEFLRNEINLLSRHADSYLLHEHLSSFNNPVYFHDFMEQATEHKLSYLSDAIIETMYTDNLPPVFANELKKISNIIITGQYMDFIRNQRFRCTLLCHQGQIVNRSLKTIDIEQFHLQLIGKPQNPQLSDKDIGEGKEVVFANAAVTYKIRNPISQLAMLILFEEHQKPIHYSELCQKVAERGSVKDLNIIKQYLNEDLNLMRAALAGLIYLSSHPGEFSTTVTEKPLACPLASYQAKNLGYATNRRHQAVRLGALTLVILPHLDGKQDIDALIKIAEQSITEGKISILDNNKQPITDKAVIAQQLREAIQNEFKFLASNALLIERIN
ncbi:MAG: methyltransferase regulatory domain-containing protein [Candidatus Berkiellales bacterium]